MLNLSVRSHDRDLAAVRVVSTDPLKHRAPLFHHNRKNKKHLRSHSLWPKVKSPSLGCNTLDRSFKIAPRSIEQHLSTINS